MVVLISMFCISSTESYLVTPGEFFLKLIGLVEPWLLLAGVLELSCDKKKQKNKKKILTIINYLVAGCG